MKTLNWLNEKGNVSVKVRDGVRKQVKEKFAELLLENFEESVPNANGGISVAIATDKSSGQTIYAHFDFTVNLKNPNEKTERKKGEKKDKVEEPAIPELF